MKILLTIIVALFASAGVALLIRDDPGYVLVTVGQWTVESTVAVLIVGVTLAFFALYIGVRLIMRLLHFPSDVVRANERRRERKAHRLLADGMGELAQGRWKSAERTLLLSTRHSDTPILGYLGAAEAAQHLGDTARRDHHLSDARQTDERAAPAIGLQEAELQLDSGQLKEAAQSLESLRRRYPRHPQVLRRLMEAYRSLRDWQGLLAILPDIHRRRVMPEAEFRVLERDVCRELLATKAKIGDRVELQRAWSKIPRRLRSDHDLVVDYAGYLEGHDAADEAERLLRKTVSSHWHPKLALAYGEITRGDAAQQMKTVEGWLKSREQDPDLLLTAGRVARRNRLWAKARGFYEASIAQRPTPDAYHELGSLLDQLEEPEKARECYRNGLQLLTGRELTTANTVLEFKPGDEGTEPSTPAEERVDETGKAVEKTAGS